MAPFVGGDAPSYLEFLRSQGFSLVLFFLPYNPNPVGWLIEIFGTVLFFAPAIAAYLAVHKPVRWLCVSIAALFFYWAIEVLVSYPATDRNGCEDCSNVTSFQIFVGLISLVIAICSRAFRNRGGVSK